MERKIFDERGFLTKEGKTFVEDGFGKELKRVLNTATNHSDVMIISGLLKSMVGEYTANLCRKAYNGKSEIIKPEIKFVPKETTQISTANSPSTQFIIDALSMLQETKPTK